MLLYFCLVCPYYPSAIHLQQRLGLLENGLSGDAVLLVKDRSWCRGAESVNTDGNTLRSNILLPAEGGTSLDRHTLGDGSREDGLLVVGILLLEDLPAWHGHHTGLNTLLLESLASGVGHLKLGSGTHDDDLRSTLALEHSVGTLSDTCNGGGWQVGHTLAGKGHGGWALAILNSDGVGSCGLVSITGPHHEHVGHGTEGGDVLNGLMGGAILSQTNGVVGHDEDGSGLGKSGHTHC
mmetsp:Transcript_32881/g.39803  ORF Transcript_32881/g.39803 Transcript_32881/m.39803 type:complete len:237 (+) Transcript_32881:111-821(+)